MVRGTMRSLGRDLIGKLTVPAEDKMRQMLQKIQGECTHCVHNVAQKVKLLEALNPERVLSQGYAILSGKISPGNVVKITTVSEEIEAEVKKVKERKKDGGES